MNTGILRIRRDPYTESLKPEKYYMLCYLRHEVPLQQPPVDVYPVLQPHLVPDPGVHGEQRQAQVGAAVGVGAIRWSAVLEVEGRLGTKTKYAVFWH